jgi:preprotein translocase subunit SecE
MAKKPGNLAAMRNRASKAAAAVATPAAGGAPTAPAAPKSSFNLFQFLANLPKFFREVRAETRKITWPSRKETWITSVMVFIMVAITSVFFYVVDLGLNVAVSQILKLANV